MVILIEESSTTISMVTASKKKEITPVVSKLASGLPRRTSMLCSAAHAWRVPMDERPRSYGDEALRKL